MGHLYSVLVSLFGSRLRAALSRSPGAPLPGLPPRNIINVSDAGAGPRCALSVSWCSLDHRRDAKKGSPCSCTLGRKRDELRSKGINDRNVNIQKCNRLIYCSWLRGRGEEPSCFIQEREYKSKVFQFIQRSV